MGILATGRGKFRQTLSGRSGRNLREYITAYLMIAPAVFLIFLFGIFPVGIAVYVNQQKRLIVGSEFHGITNYFKTLEKLVFLALFVIALGSLVWAFSEMPLR